MGDDGGAGRVKPEFGRVQDSDERVPERVAVAVDNGEWGTLAALLQMHCSVKYGIIVRYGAVAVAVAGVGEMLGSFFPSSWLGYRPGGKELTDSQPTQAGGTDGIS